MPKERLGFHVKVRMANDASQVCYLPIMLTFYFFFTQWFSGFLSSFQCLFPYFFSRGYIPFHILGHIDPLHKTGRCTNDRVNFFLLKAVICNACRNL